MKELDANMIIANAPDPVFVSDLQGKILVANEAISELLGFRKDEVLEQSLSRFISLDEARELMGALREVDRKSTRLNSSHGSISYAVFCLKKKNKKKTHNSRHRNHPT